jgi:hypothetical protein
VTAGLEAFEETLHGVLSEIDGALEERWGSRWPLHPARPPRGTAANPQYEGLFRVTASFTAGYGSKWGPGYLFRVEFSTLADVPEADREAIEEQYKELIVKRHLVDMAIEEDKARKIALEAEERRKALEEQMRLEEEARQEEEARRLAEQEAMDAEQRALWEKQQQEEEARLEALRMEMRRQALIEQGYDPDNLLNTPFAELPPEEEAPAEADGSADAAA